MYTLSTACSFHCSLKHASCIALKPAPTDTSSDSYHAQGSDKKEALHKRYKCRWASLLQFRRRCYAIVIRTERLPCPILIHCRHGV